MVAKETMDTIEKTLGAVEETLETVERIPRANLNGTTKKQQWIILGVTAAFSALVGGTGTYYLAKKKLGNFYKLHYEEVSNQEIEEAKKYYAARNKRNQYADPTTVLKEIVKDEIEGDATTNEFSEKSYEGKVGALNYATEGPKATEAELISEVRDLKKKVERIPPTVKKIMDEDEPSGDFDYAEEVPKRTADAPYVIHHDEFYEGERDYPTVVATFYEEDGVLVDDNEQPIEDSDATVGDENLSRFGYGSKDNNIVYVRNERLGTDFEIKRRGGSYTKEVLGFIEHSDTDPVKRRGSPRKFRGDRE